MGSFKFIEVLPMKGMARDLEENVTIGREGCDVVLADPEVSRRHATLRMTPAGPAVEDLGSSNGTYVNGVRIEGVHALRVGDAVRFGNTEWRLQAVGDGGRTAIGEAPPVEPAPEPGPRGDVPPPPSVTPSALHRVLPAEAAAAPPPFAPVAARNARGSAATRSGYTIVCLALGALTLIALVLYFLTA